MRIGVVVLNYNDHETTVKLINLIKNYNTINNIVVVDNCSTDNSFERLKKFNSNGKIDVIQSDKNGGYSYGNNYGVKYLVDKNQSDIIFIANPDIEVEENVLKSIIEQFQISDYAMLSCLMADSKGQLNKNYIWNLNGYTDDFSECFIIYNYLQKKLSPKKIDLSKDIVDVGILPGSFFAIRADVFKEVNYFDEGTFLFCEERILAHKLHKKEYKIGLITTCKYNHIHSVSIKKAFKAIETQKMLYNSRLYYHSKYNSISKTKYALLKVAMKYSIYEGLVLRLLRVLK